MIDAKPKTARTRKRPSLAARAVVVLGAGIAMAVPIARADGQTVDGLNSKLDTARGQAERLGTDIEAKILAQASARQQASAAARREAELSATLARGQERSTALAEDLAAARADLTEARERLQRAQRVLADRLVEIYKTGSPDDVNVLLNADGYDDLATRAELLGRVQDADRSLAERVAELRSEVAHRVAAVGAAKARSDALNAQVQAARDQIAAARSQAEARAAELARARSQQAAALDSLQGQMAAWSDRVQELERVPEQEAATEVASWTNDGDWVIPEAIVMCESGGNYGAVNPSSGAGGAYQIMPSTWELYGGEGEPHEASPAEQDAVAAQIWADSGPGAWVCAG